MSNENVKKFFSILKSSIKSGADNGLYSFSKQIINTTIANSKLPKSGRKYPVIYKNGKKYENHIASKANYESAAMLSGDLNDARKFFVQSQKAIVGVESNIKYADFIESTRQDTKKAYEENEKDLENTVLSAIITNIERNLK
jgi:hypothetical protein